MNSNSTSREIRKFGGVALLFFGTLGGVALWRDKTIPVYIFGALALLGLCFLILPGPFRPIYKAWLKTAHFIGTVFTLSILTVAYYAVMTPAGWIKRMFGGPPLPLMPDPDINSYWVARKEPAQPKERFYLRY